VKNVTVSVEDSVYRAARIRAAERGTSLSALVAEYLRSLAADEPEFTRLEGQQREVAEQLARVRASERIDRDALHSRAIR
jgi:hypothetical protein